MKTHKAIASFFSSKYHYFISSFFLLYFYKLSLYSNLQKDELRENKQIAKDNIGI